MAKDPSKQSGSDTPTQGDLPDSLTTEVEGSLGGDTVLIGDAQSGEDVVAAEPEPGSRVTIEPGDTTAPEDPHDDDPAQTELLAETSADTASDTSTDTAEPETSAASEAAPVVVERRGPGFLALLLGGALAAALGFAASMFGLLQFAEDTAPDPALVEALTTIETQGATIATLQEQLDALAAAPAPEIPEVDLSGVEGAIASVGEDVSAVSGAVEGLTERVVALEERPVFTGELDEDSAAMAAAVEALEARLTEERTAAAAAIEEAEAVQTQAAAELQAASEAAQAAIAEAEARAQETAQATQTQAALSRLQIAFASGDPFAQALAELDVEIPEALSTAAETGVPTNDEIQAAFPAAARAALPIALREVAGDSTADRLGAFFMGQVGGRSVEPREGDGPDAVLSRAEAAVAAGDIDTALSEISALPEGAQAALQDWVTLAETRAAADAALADLAATLDN